MIKYLLFGLAFIASSLIQTSDAFHSHQNVLEKFVDWTIQHDKQYLDGAEFNHRFGIFAQWNDFIEQHNMQKQNYTLAHNQFSDLSHEEFVDTYLGYNSYSDYKYLRGQTAKNFHIGTEYAYEFLPDNWDWRSHNAVTPVKQQGSAGSCYSFSSTGALEGIYSITHGELVSFSEQQIVSCDNFIDNGVDGGNIQATFVWIAKNKGLCSEDDYPYTSGTTGENGECLQSQCTNVKGSDIKSYVNVQEDSHSLLTAVYQQPVSVAIQANQIGFQFYSGGVYTGKCGDRLDHAVLTVGYGVDEDTQLKYWLVKNSWGTSWGQDGYILIERDSDANDGGGLCGILEDASFPIY